MKVLQIVSGVDEEADGVATAAVGLATNMAKRGYDVRLACATPHTNREMPDGMITAPSSQFLKWDVNLRLAAIISRVSNDFDVIHNHGLWNPINIAAGYLVPGKHAKLVTSPHGTLSAAAMQFSQRKKKLLWPLQNAY